MENKYNFHSHTFRCGHASSLPDETYLSYASKIGYQKYGFTDHVPVHPLFYWDDKMRMHDYQVDEYLNSINELKKKYPQIYIYRGFEAEYDEIIEDYLCQLKEKCDYLLLGQHYILNNDVRTSPEYPLLYAKKVCRAIESGIFDIVAHPDIFMKFLPKINDAEDRQRFIDNSLVAASLICSKAKEYDIPLEFNLGGIIEQEKGFNVLYPDSSFWKVAINMGNSAVIGIDAHYPKELLLREEKIDFISKEIDLTQINFLPDSYDPVSARKNNSKLITAYENTKSKLSTVEAKLVENILIEFNQHSTNFDINTILDYLKNELKKDQSSKNPKNETAVNFANEITRKKRDQLFGVITSITHQISLDLSSNPDEVENYIVSKIDTYYQTDKVKKLVK